MGVKSNFKQCAAVNVSYGVIGDKLVGPHIFLPQLTSNIYTKGLENELPEFLEGIPLHTHHQIYHQHDRAPNHSWKCAEIGQTVYPGRRRPFWTLVVNTVTLKTFDGNRTTYSNSLRMFSCPLLLFIHISESHSFVMVENWTHVDMTFLTQYEVKNLILKLWHKGTDSLYIHIYMV
jgi:hypothetical protein